jgi:hypothetical protein
MIETATDPRTGNRINRRLHGSVLAGRLLVAKGKSGNLDLLWIGRASSFKGCLDDGLCRLIKASPAGLHLIDQTANEVSIWLCRLPAGQYEVEYAEGGGAALFELLDPQAKTTRRTILVRPGQNRPVGNIARYAAKA